MSNVLENAIKGVGRCEVLCTRALKQIKQCRQPGRKCLTKSTVS